MESRAGFADEVVPCVAAPPWGRSVHRPLFELDKFQPICYISFRPSGSDSCCQPIVQPTVRVMASTASLYKPEICASMPRAAARTSPIRSGTTFDHAPSQPHHFLLGDHRCKTEASAPEAASWPCALSAGGEGRQAICTTQSAIHLTTKHARTAIHHETRRKE